MEVGLQSHKIVTTHVHHLKPLGGSVPFYASGFTVVDSEGCVYDYFNKVKKDANGVYSRLNYRLGARWTAD